MPDVIAIGSALVELSPESAGQSLVEARRLIPLASGAAANFTIALARLGVSVGLITRVGADELGEWLLRRLAEAGVEAGLARAVPGQLTPCSFCWADGSGAKTFRFYRFPGFSEPMSELRLEEAEANAIREARIFDFTEATIRAEPLRSVGLGAARLARGCGVEVCYAVNYRPAAWGCPAETIAKVQREAIAAADIVLMNCEEAALILGTDDLARAAERARALGPRLVAITGGESGALVAGQEQTWVEPLPVRALYDVGAGDAFHAGLLAGLLQGMPAHEAGRFASIAAALRISRPSDAPGPTFTEVLARMAEC